LFIFAFAADAKAPKAEKKIDNCLLWRITKVATNDTSYLFGTIHIICADDYIWTKAMNEHFLKAKALCLEMNLDEPDLMSSVGMKMIDLSGKQIKDYFKNEQDYNLLAHYIEDSLHQNINLLQQLKPIALYLMFSMDVKKVASCQESVSYELKLLESAHKNQQKIAGLETMDDQWSILEHIPTDSIITQLMDMVRGTNAENNAELAQLTNAYKKQDLNKLHSLMETTNNIGMKNIDLVDKRNEKWVPKIAAMMQEQSTFFAVGAGHLFGLIELLRNNGYIVEALK
jgi:uncharacterized protein YbaP (TraB family)